MDKFCFASWAVFFRQIKPINNLLIVSFLTRKSLLLPLEKCFRDEFLVANVSLNCTAFAPYRVRPFEFAPTLCRVRPHTFRVQPHH